MTALEKQSQGPTAVPEAKATSNHRPRATFTVAIAYKGNELIAELRLTQEIIGQLAIEAEFREMNLAELTARTIELVAVKDQFDLVLGQPPKRVRDRQ